MTFNDDFAGVPDKAPAADHSRAIRYGCLGAALFICLLVGGCNVRSYMSWSQGSREGKLIKFSVKGYPGFKHYEGDLSTGALGRNNANMDNSMIWHFSVKDPLVAKELDDALGEEVVIHYTQYMASGFLTDTEYVATKVKRKGR